MIYLKIGSLIVSLLFTFSTIGNLYNEQSVPAGNFVTMAIGWTVFIFSMGWL